MKKLFNIPNILSIVRLLMVPVIIALFFIGEINQYNMAILALLVLSGLTDFLDGYIARKYGLTTELGKILDPLADKVTQAATCICMFVVDLLPLWMAVFLVLKEFIMLLGGAVMLKKYGRVIKSNIMGKLATFAFYVMFVLILAGAGVMSEYVKMALVLVPIILTLAAFCGYAREFYLVVKQGRSFE